MNRGQGEHQTGVVQTSDMGKKIVFTISPSTLIFAAIKGSLGIYTLYIPPDVAEK